METTSPVFVKLITDHLLDGYAAKKRIERLEKTSKRHNFTVNSSLACNPRCQTLNCDNQDHNDEHLEHKLEVFEPGIMGKGVRALQLIKKGVLVT
ncbi:unnamed protein product [Orchesella dallaii]|uniref:Uncharacterized protein n=1 Tax=Orchesella dallaii TaxID=48710 RepID=A0ABP1RPT0_9HEXA